MLDDPDVLQFFAVYYKNGYRIEYSARRQKNILIVNHPPSLTNEELERPYNTMVEMRRYTRFQFTDEAFQNHTCFASTKTFIRLPEEPTIYVSESYISSSFLDALRHHQNPISASNRINHYLNLDGVDRGRDINIDATSSKLRVIIVLATTILHELSHAFRAASFGGLEPYIGDERVPEDGFAFEKWTFGGSVTGQYSPNKTLSPRDVLERQIHALYGLELRPDPTATWLTDAKDRVPYTYPAYPIQAHWVASLFSWKFWEEDIIRYGGRIIRCKKAEGWRTSIKNTDDLLDRR